MSFFDKIKDIMSATDDDDDYDEEELSSFSEEAAKNTNPYQRDVYQSARTPEREKTTQFQSDRKSTKNSSAQVRNASQIQVALVKPERFEDAKTIANHLAEGHTVVVNLEATARDIQRRLIDFLSGVTYAHKGNIKRVANSTFIITPNNVDVMGELLLDEIESANNYL